MKIESVSLINGWSLWNLSGVLNNSKELQIRLNRFFIESKIDYRMIQLEMSYIDQKFLRIYSYVNQSNFIRILFEIPGYRYESDGKLSADYTNLSLDFRTIENSKKKSQINFEFLSFSNNLILNLTSNIRNQYFLTSIHNFTFNNSYLYQSNIQSRLKMYHYQLFSYHSFAEYFENSTMLNLLNGSIHLPSLFFSKPFLFHYKKDSQLFLQFFEWANLTRISTNYNISTVFGLQISLINDLSTKILIYFEENFLGKRYLLIFEIDRNWIVSVILNKKIRYEFLSSPIDSQFLIKRIDLSTNQTRQLAINYHTDNQTLIRIEILFSKYFSRFINDFIFDMSFKNHSLKFHCYIPLFKREFFSLIWKRYVQKELFHFHGLIETKFLRRRRFIDYEYNYNLASIRYWTFKSRLIIFSLDPIQWNLNITNDYLWNGKWAIDFDLMLGQRRELIRLNHKYHYTTFLSNLLFNLHLINSHYDLDFNYYHLNHSIQGSFIKNKYKNEINGYWNTSENILQLNTQHMKSITTIKSIFLKSIIDVSEEKIGVLIHRTTSPFINDTQIMEVVFECHINRVKSRIKFKHIVSNVHFPKNKTKSYEFCLFHLV